ncbi:MAG: DUF983 domain-containing protein [Dehalococcoidia bacterium]|nr:MAG: DUF983 domain-containing protein [Dehalococcoidia bacterium]
MSPARKNLRPGEQTGLLLACWRTVVRERCPHCGKGRFFSGFAGLRPRCTGCDLRYEASEGAWLGAPGIGYGVGALLGIVFSFVELRWHWIASTGLDPLWTIAIGSVVASAVAYRPSKALWFAILYRWDFMAFGDAPAGPSDV